MTHTDTEIKVRSALLEFTSTTPLASPHQPRTGDRSSLSSGRTMAASRKSHRRLYLSSAAGAVAVAVAVVVVTALAPSAHTPTSTFTEAEFGMTVTRTGSPTVPDGNTPVPATYVVIATGTVLRRPWVVSGNPSLNARLCVAIAYQGSLGSDSCGPSGDPGTRPAGAPPLPEGYAARVTMSLWTAPDRQRFLVGVTNGAVTSVLVRSPSGSTVQGSVIPHRLGNRSFFLLSLGREGGICHDLCQGSVSISMHTSAGSVKFYGGRSAIRMPDYQSISQILDIPMASQLSRTNSA